MKKIQLTIVLVLLMVMVFFFNVHAGEKKVIEKTFKAVETVNLRLISGDCEIKKGKNGQIKVHVVHTYAGDKYQPVLKLEGNSLLLKDDFSDKNKGKQEGSSTWTVTVPEKTNIDSKIASGDIKITGLKSTIDSKSASGDIAVTGFRGKLSIKAASGDMLITDSSATFELSCASGDIRADKIQVNGPSQFKTASGDVLVTLDKTAGHDMKLVSVSGDATLDYDGNKMKGLFTFKGQKDEISSAVPFGKDADKSSKHTPFVKRTVQVGSSAPKISLTTVTGRLTLKK